MYTCNLTNKKQRDITTDGTYLEKISKSMWVDNINTSVDILNYFALHKLKELKLIKE